MKKKEILKFIAVLVLVVLLWPLISKLITIGGIIATAIFIFIIIRREKK